MTEFQCPECKDTGVYQGLNTVEPCRACGGRKSICSTAGGLNASSKGVESALRKANEIIQRKATELPPIRSPSHVTDMCQQFAVAPFGSPELARDFEVSQAVMEKAMKAWLAETFNSGGQSLSHETHEQITEEWPKPFDEIMPAELEGLAEGQFVNVEFDCQSFIRAYSTLNRIIDRPLFGLPSKAFKMVNIQTGFNANGNRVGRLKLVRLYGGEIGDSDPCHDMLFLPIVED